VERQWSGKQENCANDRRQEQYRLRILVVDDDEQVRKVLTDMLAIHGHHTTTCPDAYIALEVVKKERFDLLIIDLGMPGISGLDLAGVIHAAFPQMPIALTTGCGKELNPDEISSKGVSAVLFKPFCLKDVKSLVEELVGR